MRSSVWDLPYEIESLDVHSDHRGSLFEAIRFKTQKIPQGGQLYVYTVMPGERRGDHYHAYKQEWFCCVAGQVRVKLRTPDGSKINELVSAKAPKLVYTGPGTSHAVVNERKEEAVIIAYSSKEFDPSEPDTISAVAD